MELFFRLVVFAASAWISVKYAVGYWVVGPVFGLAVVCWDSNTFKKFVAAKHLSFLAASTLIYALVYHISTLNWDHGSDFLDSIIGSLPIAVVLGSVLLPLAHKFLFSSSFKRVARLIILLILSFYIITLFSFANDHFEWSLKINFLAIAITVWQGLYLYFLFQPFNKS